MRTKREGGERGSYKGLDQAEIKRRRTYPRTVYRGRVGVQATVVKKSGVDESTEAWTQYIVVIIELQ